MRCKILVIILFFLLVSALPISIDVAFSAANQGINIVGVGNNPSSAVRDCIRQIQEVFGRCFIESETVVRNFVLEKDVIRGKIRFSGSKLDRFYEGVFKKGGKYFAVFRFPGDFVSAVQSRKRDTGRSRISASFDVVQYNSVEADSFGEVSKRSWRVKLPESVRKFIDFFVWDIDDAKGFEIVKEKR